MNGITKKMLAAITDTKKEEKPEVKRIFLDVERVSVCFISDKIFYKQLKCMLLT